MYSLLHTTFTASGSGIRGRCPQYFKEYFKCNGSVHQRATRQKNQLHLPAVRTETAKRSFYYYGCTVFNSFMQ